MPVVSNYCQGNTLLQMFLYARGRAFEIVKRNAECHVFEAIQRRKNMPLLTSDIPR
jgi:hypothetical protein